MQTTSAIWDALWASGTATLDAVAVIGGVEYTDISAPLITRGTMQGQLSVGNVVSACCALSVRAASSAIPRSATVQIKHRLVSADGATVSEWLPAGTFYISRRRVDPINGVVILECYDALLKSNEDMPTLPGVTYPISMTVAAQTIAQIIGMDIDARTVIQTGAEYIISAPTAGTTMRDILATIAGANAGNWIMSPAGKLRLVPVVDVTETASPLAVSGVIGGIQIGDAGVVTGVRREDEDGNQILIGTDGGIIVDVGLSAPLALAASEILIGQVYQPYAMTGAVYSPAAEIGDPVDADGTGTVIGVLYNETASFGPAYRGDISAPGATEYSNEYPFIGGNAKTLTLARAYAREVTQALDNSLDQEEVFNRLTDNGLIQGLYMLNGQLYVNANYIRSGTLVLGGLNNVNGLLQILDANGNLITQGDNRGLIINNGRIALQIPSVQTGGNDLYINDEWNTAGVKYALRNVANLGNGQYSTVLIDRGVLSVIDGNNESVRLKTTNLTPGNVSVNAVGAMDTAALALDGYGQTSTDPDVIEWSRMGMRLSNEKVRFYLGNGSSAAQTWFALSLGQLSYRGDVLLTKPLPVSSGGTGASTAAAALSALGGVAVTDIVDNLASTATNKPLSAAQGKALNDNLTKVKSMDSLGTFSSDGTVTLNANMYDYYLVDFMLLTSDNKVLSSIVIPTELLSGGAINTVYPSYYSDSQTVKYIIVNSGTSISISGTSGAKLRVYGCIKKLN